MISMKMDEEQNHVREVRLSMTLTSVFQLLPRKGTFHVYSTL
jgi:hypothetical protein